jgi:hypothetical protein
VYTDIGAELNAKGGDKFAIFRKDIAVKHPLNNEEMGFKLLRKVNTYDLQEVAPLAESLKKYAARMHARRLQELPYPPDSILTPEEKINTREYCFVDLVNTDLLRQELTEQVALRVNLGKMYGGIDLRSKSDAQIAETVIGSELKNLKGYYPKKPEFDPDYVFGYKAPDYVKFQTKPLQDMLEQVKSFRFTLSSNGSPHNPYLSAKEGYDGFIVEVGGKKYAMGLGGLHSMEQRQSIKPAKSWGLFDTDFEFLPVYERALHYQLLAPHLLFLETDWNDSL